MDDAVLRAMMRWPDVPAVAGWLALDRRGRFLLREPGSGRFEPIGNTGLREFIARNYAADTAGRWHFQNGPQRVYVTLAYTPLVFHEADGGLVDHCGRALEVPRRRWLDDEGSLLLEGPHGVGVLDDRDLGRVAEAMGDLESLPRLTVREVPARFGFVPAPAI